MQVLLNFWKLSQVSIPFLRLFCSYQDLCKGRGRWYRFWSKACAEIPALLDAPPSLQKRMWHYLFANSVTSLWFSVLRGRALTKGEELAGLWLGIATPVADYLVDVEKLDYLEIQALLNLRAKHPLGQLAHHLLTKCCQLHHDQALFDKYLESTQLAQDASLDQLAGISHVERELKVMSDKGGYALLLYRSALENHISPAEERAAYNLGAFVQLHNDLMDVYRDQTEGIVTLATRGLPVSTLREHYQKQIAHVLSSFEVLNYKKKNKDQFKLLFSLVAETGNIALDQFEALQPQGQPFKPWLHGRDALVCDMEDITKICRVIWSTLSMKTLSVPYRAKREKYEVS